VTVVGGLKEFEGPKVRASRGLHCPEPGYGAVSLRIYFKPDRPYFRGKLLDTKHTHQTQHKITPSNS